MKKTAFVYDPFNLRHTLDGHPENFRRLQSTWTLLEEDGILTRLLRVASSPAAQDAILRIHTPHYLERLETAALTGGGRLDADTYMNAHSHEAALLAAGGLLNLVDAVLWGQADNGFALVRPPGHHALVNQAMGFCILANVAIAARWAQDHHGVDRVLIVDFDVHHGNGTQDIFYDDPSILFFSAHQFPYYPGSGNASELGTELARGSTVNVPFPAHVGDEGYLDAIRRILAPLAREFRPGLILLSAGYDAHWLDPLASMRLTIPGYAALVGELMSLADELCHGRFVCALEGGYHVDVLAHCILTTLRTLSQEPDNISDPFGAPLIGAERDAVSLLERVKKLHGIADPPFYSLPS
jgi:acetoin utilization deacetylase AcuC-like enzyme